MNPLQAAALRREFPAATIGKLPKPYSKDAPKGRCDECGGYHGLPAVHLDYVGHAATTDRLLQVDPEWNWEPLALDERGHPAVDGGGNLWIRLTVAGVTRIGVGDGKSAKECIGDAIRNAAMRFGVALDLWAKEDLHSMAEERGEPATPEPAPTGEPKPTTRRMGLAVTQAQLSKMHACFNDLGITDRQERLDYTNRVVARDKGHEVTSSKELTKAEAVALINHLDADVTAAVPSLAEPEEPT
jgi:hypothetical protein